MKNSNNVIPIGDIRKMIGRERYGVMEKTLTITDLIVDKLEELENKLNQLNRRLDNTITSNI